MQISMLMRTRAVRWCVAPKRWMMVVYLVGDGGGDERSPGNCNERKEEGKSVSLNNVTVVN